jgi:hypothetical protein
MLNNTYNKKNLLTDAMMIETLKKKKAADMYGTGVLTESGNEYRLMITFVDVSQGNNAGGAKVYFKKDKELQGLDAKTVSNFTGTTAGATPAPAKPKKSAEELLQSLNKIAVTANTAVKQYEEIKKSRKSAATPTTPPPAPPTETTPAAVAPPPGL